MNFLSSICKKSFSKCFQSYNETAVIVGSTRTAMGSFGKSLKDFSGIELAALSIRECIDQVGVDEAEIEEMIVGCCLVGGLGQNPPKQISMKAGLNPHTISTFASKVCSAGMKAIDFGAMSIMCGNRNCVMTGGFESMTNAPYYLTNERWGAKYGDSKIVCGVEYDGLYDNMNDHVMGVLGDHLALDYDCSREEQDAYAIESYRRGVYAHENGLFKDEIFPVTLKDGTIFEVDEEIYNINLDKVSTLRPVFRPDGTVTAANCSPLSDGSNAVLLMSERKAMEDGYAIRAKILGFDDYEQIPERTCSSPAHAIEAALKKANLTLDQVDFVEIMEPFAVVPIVNCFYMLGIPHEQVNVHGGAVALGHPLGSSGSRMVVTLLNVLEKHDGRIGVAVLCNGGGGASAMVIEKV